MILKLGLKHQGMELYKVYINHDLGMTLTYFTTRSTSVAYAFEWGKVGKCQIMVGNLLGMSKWTEVYEKVNTRGVVCQVYWYISQISGE